MKSSIDRKIFCSTILIFSKLFVIFIKPSTKHSLVPAYHLELEKQALLWALVVMSILHPFLLFSFVFLYFIDQMTRL